MVWNQVLDRECERNGKNGPHGAEDPAPEQDRQHDGQDRNIETLLHEAWFYDIVANEVDDYVSDDNRQGYLPPLLEEGYDHGGNKCQQKTECRDEIEEKEKHAPHHGEINPERNEKNGVCCRLHKTGHTGDRNVGSHIPAGLPESGDKAPLPFISVLALYGNKLEEKQGNKEDDEDDISQDPTNGSEEQTGVTDQAGCTEHLEGPDLLEVNIPYHRKAACG